MAALICIKRVRGTFCQLVNIANRFLCIFSNLETSIRFIFPGGAGYPYLPTRLYVNSMCIQCILNFRNILFLSGHISHILCPIKWLVYDVDNLSFHCKICILTIVIPGMAIYSIHIHVDKIFKRFFGTIL